MNIFFQFILSIVVLLAFVESVMPQVMRARNSFELNGIIYFADPSDTLRSYTEARSFCQSQEGELAKVTNRTVFNHLRFLLTTPSTYWINGMDKTNHERFAVDMNCSPGQLDFSDMSPNNVALEPKSCLSLVKGTSAANSRIEAMDCIIPNRVLCSMPLVGCMESD